MIGLRGKNKKERIQNYFYDMNLAILKMARVLEPNKYRVIIIGSDEIQIGGIRHDLEIKKYAQSTGLILQNEMIKPIKGI